MNLKKAKTIRTLLLVIACITLMVGFFQSAAADKVRKHNPEKIDIEIAQIESKYDSSKYYVVMDYEISNNTSVKLDYVKVITYVYDIDDRRLGTITSEFGNSYSNSINVQSGGSVIQSTSLSANQNSSSFTDVFVELYNNGMTNARFEYEIVSAKWSDNYRYSGN